MKTLYESILDSDLGSKTDTKLDMFGTTKKAFERRNLDPLDFFEMRRTVLDGKKIDRNSHFINFNEEEIYAISNFIKHMHEKYGQQDIYLSAWSLYEGDYMMYDINKGMNYSDRGFITDDLNMYMTTFPSKIDQWIIGIDSNSETSWFLATLKVMKKEEKETWLEIMKAIERYFN